MASFAHSDGSKNTDTIMDIRNMDVIGIEKDANIYDAMLGLVTNRISKIFVMDNGKPIGIITDKDIIRFLFIDRSGRDLRNVLAQEIMNDVCYVVGSLTCQQAAQTMLINKISTLGIGSREKLKGIITKTDLIRYYVNTTRDTFRSSDYMTISYFSTSSDSKLQEVIRKMVTCDISRIIIDNGQKPVGIITNGDVFRTTMSTCKMSIVQSSLSNYTEHDGLWSETGFVGSQMAGEVMTEGIISVDSSTDMKNTAKMILDKNIDSVGINNSKGQLVGLINKTNILYALANFGGI